MAAGGSTAAARRDTRSSSPSSFRRSSTFSPMATVRCPSSHRRLAAVLLYCARLPAGQGAWGGRKDVGRERGEGRRADPPPPLEGTRGRRRLAPSHRSSPFSLMAAVNRPSPHRSLAVVLLFVRARSLAGEGARGGTKDVWRERGEPCTAPSASAGRPLRHPRRPPHIFPVRYLISILVISWWGGDARRSIIVVLAAGLL